jgi:hypothetical protein
VEQARGALNKDEFLGFDKQFFAKFGFWHFA